MRVNLSSLEFFEASRSQHHYGRADGSDEPNSHCLALGASRKKLDPGGVSTGGVQKTKDL